MAFPTLWSLQSATRDWQPQTGWRINHVWHGPAGVSKADLNAWLAEWQTVYGQPLTISIEESMILDDGNAVCVARISLGSTEDGEPLDPEDDDYGLLERNWTLGGVDQQLSIRENPRVEDLAEFWRPWPALIRDWVYVYSEAQSGALKVWNDAGQEGVPLLVDWAVPIPPTSAGTPDEALLDNATTLAERLLTDPQATWQKSGYQLRKTERVTSWSTLVVSHLYVDRLLTWAALSTMEPTLAGTGLIQTGDLEDLLWLKAAPEVTATSGGNYELTQVYTSFEVPTADSKRERDLQFDYGDIISSIA